MSKTYQTKDLEGIYTSLTRGVKASCEFSTDCVGGQPAGEKGIRAFAEHHLGLVGDDLEAAVKRIMAEEVGEKDTTQPLDEIKEEKVYGVNVVRRDEHGVWLGNWMVRACLKCAASRLGIFQAKKGSKGDMAEMMRVSAHGSSLNGDPNKIRPYTKDGGKVETRFEKFMGSVTGPSGRKSIVHNSEIIPAGSRFSFELRIPAGGKIKEKDILLIFSVIGQIGLGSVKALDRGKFLVSELEIEGKEE